VRHSHTLPIDAPASTIGLAMELRLSSFRKVSCAPHARTVQREALESTPFAHYRSLPPRG